ncbi:MAG: endonuclease [Bacteroidales bacterium]|nr:endonuclease [Bacteroidales bacterium]
MKKILLSVICCLLSVICVAAIPAGYYASADGKTGDAICEALHAKIKSHTDVGYDGLYNVYPTSDVVPGTNEVWDIYSTCTFTHGKKQCGNYSKVCDCYNREHTIPQSWFKEAHPMKSDAFHVYPTDGKVNGQRSNNPYGECANGTSLGGKALGKLGSSTFGGYSGKVFEPVDEYKGDVARNYFYMVTCYRDKNFTQSSEGKVMFTYNGGKAAFTNYSINLLMKWHRQDPVSQKEIDRNNAVYKHQGNRNPFIDYPCFAEYIWGDQKTTQLYLDNLVSSEDAHFFDDPAGCSPEVDPTTPQLLEPKINTIVDLGGASVGEPVYKTIRVVGKNLSVPVTCSISGTDATLFAVQPAQLSASDVMAGITIQISYTPTTTGDHTAILTLASSELSDAHHLSLTGPSHASLISPNAGEHFSFMSYGVGDTVSQQILIKGTNLTSPIWLNVATFSKNNFSVTPESLTAEQVNEGTYVTVAYTSDSIGEISSTLYISSQTKEFDQVTCGINGACVFDILEPTDITDSQATLNWTDAGVESYLVDVFILDQEEQEEKIVLNSVAGEGAVKSGYTDTQTQGAIRLGSGKSTGAISYSGLDFSGGATVTVNAKCYGTDDTQQGGVQMNVVINGTTKSVLLNQTYTDYTFDVPSGSSASSTLKVETTMGGRRAYVAYVKAVTGGTKEVRTHIDGYPREESFLSHTVYGLQKETEYSYTVTPKGGAASDVETFTTTDGTISALEDVEMETRHTAYKRIAPSGHLLIHYAGRTYSAQGQRLK